MNAWRSTGLWPAARTVALGLACLGLAGCKERPARPPTAAGAPAPQKRAADDKQAAPDKPAAPTSGRIWVERHISGGEQCRGRQPELELPGAKVKAESGPPSMAEVIKDLPFRVHDTRREAMAVCRACGCPAYAFAYRLLIDAGDLQKARAAGFKPSR